MDAHHPAATGDGVTEPFTPRQLRILKIAVVVMGIILLVGFAAVIGRIAYLVTKGGATQTPAAHALAKTARLPLPGGAAVRSVALDGNRLAVHYDTPVGAGIAILDLVTGEPLVHVDLAPR
jgi:hypothetical protein